MCIELHPVVETRKLRDRYAGAELRQLRLNSIVGEPAKRKRALLGSNPPRNSRWKLTAMSALEPASESSPALRVMDVHRGSSIAVDFPMPCKPGAPTGTKPGMRWRICTSNSTGGR